MSTSTACFVSLPPSRLLSIARRALPVRPSPALFQPAIRSAMSPTVSHPLPPADCIAMLRKADLIHKTLRQLYPVAPDTFLHHSDPFTLLVAVVLSAQSLDTKVNEVTSDLFRLASTPAAMAALGEQRIKSLINRIGLAPGKARNIASLSAAIVDRHAGAVPDTFEHLEALDGVGHKTASVVMMQAFNKPAFPVDTHIHRLACRWGCGHPKSVQHTERMLKLWFPDPLSWRHLHTRIILFGRQHCPPRNHDMDACPICCFAATDEARTANDASPKKFVAPLKYANPFSIKNAVLLPTTTASTKSSDASDASDASNAQFSASVVADSPPATLKRSSRGKPSGNATNEALQHDNNKKTLKKTLKKTAKRSEKRKLLVASKTSQTEVAAAAASAAESKTKRAKRVRNTNTKPKKQLASDATKTNITSRDERRVSARLRLKKAKS